METIGKYVLIFGIVLVLVGGLIYLVGRSGIADRIPFGRLPGDFQFQAGPLTCLFPLATSIILSILLTILLNVIIRLLNR